MELMETNKQINTEKKLTDRELNRKKNNWIEKIDTNNKASFANLAHIQVLNVRISVVLKTQSGPSLGMPKRKREIFAVLYLLHQNKFSISIEESPKLIVLWLLRCLSPKLAFAHFYIQEKYQASQTVNVNVRRKHRLYIELWLNALNTYNLREKHERALREKNFLAQ